jgi:hypothetical protein
MIVVKHGIGIFAIALSGQSGDHFSLLCDFVMVSTYLSLDGGVVPGVTGSGIDGF